MDIFVAIQKLDADGNTVPFAFYAQFEDGPVALGWLRASHRELDDDASSSFMPVHKHQREQKLVPGKITPVDIEIWPSGTKFEEGESLRLVIQGSDIYDYLKAPLGHRAVLVVFPPLPREARVPVPRGVLRRIQPAH